ncbi:galactokinase [Streptomyces tubercidicus]|uniref:galactokinase n=1 Tax=Streptomyces tubercidicus TaxID=47759 RepID=UPI002E151847|nr:galactokinase [Streptomyces tubercidicus]WSX24077.1 galactokinase [Streptomyces tubercidicus]
MNGVDLARRATAEPLLRLLAHGFATEYHRRPEAVWRAPYAFRLTAPAAPPHTGTAPRAGGVAAANWHVAAAVAPRDDGMLRCGSLHHPAETAELPLTGPAGRAPGWAARPYAALRALAAAGVGRGGADLQLNATLPDAVGLSAAEPLECATALAVASVHADRGGCPPARAQLARLLSAAVPGDDALRRAVLFARSGQLLAPDGSCRPLRSPDGGPPPSLLLVTARLATGGPTATATALATAVHDALRAGAWSASWPGLRPGRSVLLAMPPGRRAAVRSAVADACRRGDLPVPRFLRITVADAARRED